jgi:hypothetical protein
MLAQTDAALDQIENDRWMQILEQHMRLLRNVRNTGGRVARSCRTCSSKIPCLERISWSKRFSRAIIRPPLFSELFFFNTVELDEVDEHRCILCRCERTFRISCRLYQCQ